MWTRKVDSRYTLSVDRLFYLSPTSVICDIDVGDVKELTQRVFLFGFWMFFFGLFLGFLSSVLFVFFVRSFLLW